MSRKYRVAWINPVTKKKYYGEWLNDCRDATAAVSIGNSMYPKLKHRVERKDDA